MCLRLRIDRPETGKLTPLKGTIARNCSFVHLAPILHLASHREPGGSFGCISAVTCVLCRPVNYSSAYTYIKWLANLTSISPGPPSSAIEFTQSCPTSLFGFGSLPAIWRIMKSLGKFANVSVISLPARANDTCHQLYGRGPPQNRTRPMISHTNH